MAIAGAVVLCCRLQLHVRILSSKECLSLNHSRKFHLSTMMFLEYLIPGATAPILSLYLKDHLGFEAYQAGIIMAMPAAAAVVAPLFAARLADRTLSAEKLLALCHFSAGVLMLLLGRIHSYPLFTAVYFLYGFCFMPTFGLTNTVALHHIANARRGFTGIRMWGTVGWVAVGWAFGYFWLRGGAPGARLPHALPLSGIASLALACYVLGFKTTGGAGSSGPPMRYANVLRMFMKPGMLLLCFLTLLNSACHQYYYFGMSPFLHQAGFPDRFIMPGMSLGQASEVVVLGLMGWSLTRMSMKATMLIGVLAQGARMVLFAFAGNHAAILAGIGLHGFCFAFFFITAYLYVESHSTRETRAGAQQVLTIMIAGAGNLAGFLGAGWTAQWLTHPLTGMVNYRLFWLAPAGMSAVVFAALALWFREVKA